MFNSIFTQQFRRASVRAAKKNFRNILGTQCLTEQVALHASASLSREILQLLRILNTLCDHGEIKTLRQPDDGRDNRGAVRALMHIKHETPVDLQAVEREAAQIIQRYVSRRAARLHRVLAQR